MKNSKLSINEKIVWVLTVILIACFTIFETYSWGRYLFFLIAIVIYAFYAIPMKEFLFPINAYQKFFLVFIGFTFASAIWSISRNKTLQKGITLVQIFFLFSLVYQYYNQKRDMDILLSAIKWSGFVIGLYTIYYYGLNSLLTAATSNRIGNDFSNANTIGLVCALSVLLQLYEILFEKLNISAFFVIPSFLAIVATQSRKALVFVFIGLIFLLLMKGRNNKNPIKLAMVLVAIAVAIGGSLYALNNIDIFSGVRQRMMGLLSVIDNTGSVDRSTYLRLQMIKVGIEGWLGSPLVGVGVGAPCVLNAQYLGVNAYLHNNY